MPSAMCTSTFKSCSHLYIKGKLRLMAVAEGMANWQAWAGLTSSGYTTGMGGKVPKRHHCSRKPQTGFGKDHTDCHHPETVGGV